MKGIPMSIGPVAGAGAPLSHLPVANLKTPDSGEAAGAADRDGDADNSAAAAATTTTSSVRPGTVSVKA
jgi:hypothetical protein